MVAPVIAFTAFGAVYAASDTTKNNPMDNLVAAIASKFNLNVSDVQAVFDEQKVLMNANREEKQATMKAEMEKKVADEIAQAVTDGKLTQAQADLLVAKRAELEAQRLAFVQEQRDGSKTKEEIKAERDARQTEMKACQDSLKQWMSDNGISTDYIKFLRMGFGQGFGRGHGGPMGFDGQETDTED